MVYYVFYYLALVCCEHLQLVGCTGDYIDNIHEKWKGDYRRLEMHHGYIQWLFPIRESGLNHHAQELQTHEIKVKHLASVQHFASVSA